LPAQGRPLKTSCATPESRPLLVEVLADCWD